MPISAFAGCLAVALQKATTTKMFLSLSTSPRSAPHRSSYIPSFLSFALQRVSLLRAGLDYQRSFSTFVRNLAYHLLVCSSMMMKLFPIVSALVAATFVSAETFTIQVGADSGLTYTPSSVNASEGDTIAFQFLSKNHTVTQSTFASPCTASGVDSGFFPVTADAAEVPQWSFTINNASTPLWFFCAQTGHCARGMVFAVNANANKSFEAFQAAAMATASNTTTGTTGTTGTSTGTSSNPSVSVSSAADPSSTASKASPKLSFNGAVSILAIAGVLAGYVL